MKGGPQPRVSSPRTAGSTLMTSAPRSPKFIVQNGPAKTLDKSKTRIPLNGCRRIPPLTACRHIHRVLFEYRTSSSTLYWYSYNRSIIPNINITWFYQRVQSICLERDRSILRWHFRMRDVKLYSSNVAVLFSKCWAVLFAPIKAQNWAVLYFRIGPTFRLSRDTT